MNPALQAMLGVARERAHGQPLATLAPALYAALLAARQAPAQAADMRLEIAETQRSYTVRLSRLASDDGRMLGQLLLLRDNQARLQVEDALRVSEAQLRAIVDHSPLAIILFDTAGVILLWNAAAERCLLYTSDAADERSRGGLGGRRIIKKKKHILRSRMANQSNR